MLSPLAHALRGAEHGPVVGFRAAGGEEHPVRFRPHGGGDGVAGGTQFPGGADAEIVPQFSVSAFVMASTASEQGRVVAELSR